MTQLIGMIQSAVKAKAPIVAIPVEGRAPVCVRAKLLKGALKGVTITGAEMYTAPDVETFERPERQWIPAYKDGRYAGGSYAEVEGPAVRIVTPGARRLKITGVDGRVRTSCSIIPVDRREAIKELAKWTEKERAKQKTVKALRVSPVAARRALAKYITTHIDGEDAQTFRYREPKGAACTVQGLPVKLMGWPEMRFFVWSGVDHEGARNQWNVTEQSSGYGVTSSHSTALKAIEAAELALASGDRAKAAAMVAAHQLEPAEVAA